MSERHFLRALFDAAVAAAMPERVVPAHLPAPPKGRTLIVGAGKASAAMARALEDHWHHPLTGLVVTRYGHGVACNTIEIIEAAHPVPDAAGEQAARRILELASALGPDDLMICLISGGASALLSLPAPGLDLSDKQAVNQMLLTSAAPIGDMNCVRKHLSAIKGGRLAAAAWPAKVVSLMISDVPGDDPGTIGSGPTVGDATTLSDARAILDRLTTDLPGTITAALQNPANESPKPGDPCLANTTNIVIAAPQMSLMAAANLARQNGVTPIMLGDALEGEARDLGRAQAVQALKQRENSAPVVLLSGGETTVTLHGHGTGGRNVEFLLGLAAALDGAPDIHALACDTDGVDGGAEVAGAIITPTTLARAKSHGLPIETVLADNDGHTFFARLNDQIITGPTLTNVNDFRAILIGTLADKTSEQA